MGVRAVMQIDWRHREGRNRALYSFPLRLIVKHNWNAAIEKSEPSHESVPLRKLRFKTNIGVGKEL